MALILDFLKMFSVRELSFGYIALVTLAVLCDALYLQHRGRLKTLFKPRRPGFFVLAIVVIYFWPIVLSVWALDRLLSEPTPTGRV